MDKEDIQLHLIEMQCGSVCVYRLWPIVQSAFPPNLRLLVSFL